MSSSDSEIDCKDRVQETEKCEQQEEIEEFQMALPVSSFGGVFHGVCRRLASSARGSKRPRAERRSRRNAKFGDEGMAERKGHHESKKQTKHDHKDVVTRTRIKNGPKFTSGDQKALPGGRLALMNWDDVRIFGSGFW